MPLDPGTRLGHYEILELIGAGGMGQVYRARDSRLGREVAVKVSAERFSERFEREARVIASLNHPNICTLHDVGPNFLVMELVEGESPQGPLPYETAMNYARQIAEALEAAHDKGIVHRDLKPGNIKIKPDGTVKVLDFGLAKVGGASSAGPTEDSPTISMAATQAGVILGTAAYMAPEQARGKPVDRRADIWAFGVVLHEMLTGQRLFQGEDLTETLASVVKQEPNLAEAPARVRRLLKSCLEKDPKKRLQAIGDMRLLLEDADPAPVLSPQRASGPWAWITAGVLAAALIVALWAPWRSAPPVAEATHFEIGPPAKSFFTNWMSLSPDGRKIAFTARGEDGMVRLWVRSLDSLEAKPMVTTQNSPVPFWSPDSRYIAYQLDGKLRKVELASGSVQTLCDAPIQFAGGAWSPQNVIVFSGAGGLMRVSASGGVPQKLTSVDVSKQEASHGSPAFMPDGRHFIYFRRSSATDNNGVFAGSLDDAPDKPTPQRLMANAVNAIYAPPEQGDPGYLLFARDKALMAQPFDAEKMELKGDAVPVADAVGRMSAAFLNAAVSTSGTLIYRTSGIADLRQLTWFEDGKAQTPLTATGTFGDVALSPDGTHAAVSMVDDQQGNTDLWTVDLAKALKTRFTFDKAEDRFPVWSPDGSRTVFASNREGARNLYWKTSNGASDEELLLKSSEDKIPTDWSRDGKYLLYNVADAKTKADVYYLPMADGTAAAERKGVRFLGSEFSERQARFSPDGRFVAYSSDESGTFEIYVRSFPDGGGRWQVSKNGGAQQPHWRKDGKQIYYLAGGTRMTSVDVITGATFQSGEPKALFDARVPGGFDVSADGKRFLIAATAGEGAADPITVVLNWKSALKR